MQSKIRCYIDYQSTLPLSKGGNKSFNKLFWIFIMWIIIWLFLQRILRCCNFVCKHSGSDMMKIFSEGRFAEMDHTVFDNIEDCVVTQFHIIFKRCTETSQTVQNSLYSSWQSISIRVSACNQELSIDLLFYYR